METFEVIQQEKEGFPVFSVKGYFNKESGAKLISLVEPLLEAGQVTFLLDFTDCTVLNSPGIGQLMEIVFKTTDDFKGKIILFGANALKLQALKLTGLLNNIEIAQDLLEGIAKAKG